MRDSGPQAQPNYSIVFKLQRELKSSRALQAMPWTHLISKELGGVKAWHLPSTENKRKVASIRNSTSQLQSPGCMSHPFLPNSHGQNTSQTLPSAMQHPTRCLLPPSQHLLWAAEVVQGQRCRSFTRFAVVVPLQIRGVSSQQKLRLATSATGSTDLQCAGKLCATKNVSQRMTPTPAHSPAYRFSLLKANSVWQQQLKKTKCLLSSSGKCGLSG